MQFIKPVIKPPVTAALLLTLLSALLLQGCGGLIIGAAGGAALAAHDRRDAQTILEDQAIESKAVDSLYGDSQLNKKIHVNVTSYNRVVLVTGEVLSSKLREHAINIVRNIAQVRSVHNELVVADLTSFGSRTNDTWITSKVKSRIAGAEGLDTTRVKVVTENATVFLMGLVTEKEAQLAADAARYAKGVKRVVKVFEYIPEPEPAPQTPAQPTAQSTPANG